MPKKYTYDEVKKYIEIESDSGCKLISKGYINSKMKLNVQCKCGKFFDVSFSKFKHENQVKCAYCTNKVKLSFNEIKEFIEIKSNSGCKLISERYRNVNEKLKLKCNCGKYFYASFHKFRDRNKRQCNECAGKTNWSLDKAKNCLVSLGYELITKNYENIDSNIVFKDSFGYLYSSTLYNLLRYKRSNFVDTSNPYTLYNVKLWCKLNRKPFELISDKYKDSKKKLKWKCLKENCGEIFECKWGHIYQGVGCPFCAGRQVGLSNCLATKNPELAKEWHPTKNGYLTPYNVTCGSSKKAWWQCNKCKYEWSAIISNRNKGIGCPECAESKGEKRVSQYFEIHKVYYIPQKTFDSLIGMGGGLLSYDFYLPKHNLLIEYQGEQHEKYIPGFHSSKNKFKKQQEHDKRKRKYAQNNNINLLEIWYWDFDNIESILEKELSSSEVMSTDCFNNNIKEAI